MRPKLFVTTLIVLLGIALSVAMVNAQGPAPRAPGAAMGTAFTYQGQLKKSGSPVNSTCTFTFGLWDAASGGTQLGSNQTVSGVSVSNGLFAVQLNNGSEFGLNPFNGAARWLQISAQCTGDVGSTSLGRQQLTAAPYALGLRPGTIVKGSSDDTLRAETVSGTALVGVVDWLQSGTGTAVYGQGGFGGYAAQFNNITSNLPTVVITNSNYMAGGPALGVWGGATVTANANASALYGYNTKTSGVAHGIYGKTDAISGYGVYGTGPEIGVYGGGATAGVYGFGTMSGVKGETSSSSAHGVYGLNTHSSSGYGVYGRGFRGVQGYSTSSGGTGGFFMDMNTTASGTSAGIWSGSYYNDIIQGHELDSNGNSLDRRFRVTYQGNVYADGTYSSPAADFAEMMPAVTGLEAGDVLVIGLDGKLTRSTVAFASAVVGVHSTKPGFVGGSGDGIDPTGKIPLAIVGIVPVKASAENGAIQPGDLLVAASIPGHAMKAGVNPPVGTVIGKAFGSLQGGTGVVQMLVTLQ